MKKAINTIHFSLNSVSFNSSDDFLEILLEVETILSATIILNLDFRRKIGNT